MGEMKTWLSGLERLIQEPLSDRDNPRPDLVDRLVM
jgi:hypothetical protein